GRARRRARRRRRRRPPRAPRPPASGRRAAPPPPRAAPCRRPPPAPACPPPTTVRLGPQHAAARAPAPFQLRIACAGSPSGEKATRPAPRGHCGHGGPVDEQPAGPSSARVAGRPPTSLLVVLLLAGCGPAPATPTSPPSRR